MNNGEVDAEDRTDNVFANHTAHSRKDKLHQFTDEIYDEIDSTPDEQEDDEKPVFDKEDLDDYDSTKKTLYDIVYDRLDEIDT